MRSRRRWLARRVRGTRIHVGKSTTVTYDEEISLIPVGTTNFPADVEPDDAVSEDTETNNTSPTVGVAICHLDHR